ncbi:MAG: LacI family DNA-binding transcriptional regulator [Devosia sp.]
MTQRDIARIAGVSQATVSLVLNGDRAQALRIPEETRERVNRAIRETGYVADPIARRMSKGLNRIIGVFTYEPAFPSATADFFAPFLFGIEEGAQALGYDLLLLTGSPIVSGRRRIFHENNRLRLADGCIILGREFDRDELKRLCEGDYPFVAVGRRDAFELPVPYVGADYVTATADLVGTVKAMGHRRLAYVGPADGAESSRDRWVGFEQARGQAELSLHLSETGGAADAVLDSVIASGATALFMLELADAIELHAAALRRGLTIPGDLSLIVLGSHIRPAATGVQFTTFAVPREEMARRATQMLAERIETGGPGEQVLLLCEPVPGETLGPAPEHQEPERTP